MGTCCKADRNANRRCSSKYAPVTQVEVINCKQRAQHVKEQRWIERSCRRIRAFSPVFQNPGTLYITGYSGSSKIFPMTNGFAGSTAAQQVLATGGRATNASTQHSSRHSKAQSDKYHPRCRVLGFTSQMSHTGKATRELRSKLYSEHGISRMLDLNVRQILGERDKKVPNSQLREP